MLTCSYNSLTIFFCLIAFNFYNSHFIETVSHLTCGETISVSPMIPTPHNNSAFAQCVAVTLKNAFCGTTECNLSKALITVLWQIWKCFPQSVTTGNYTACGDRIFWHIFSSDIFFGGVGCQMSDNRNHFLDLGSKLTQKSGDTMPFVCHQCHQDLRGVIKRSFRKVSISHHLSIQVDTRKKKNICETMHLSSLIIIWGLKYKKVLTDCTWHSLIMSHYPGQYSI